MKLLLDEMWAPAIAEALRDRGHEVVAVAERGDLRGLPDEAIFDAALAEGWVIVTENVVDYRPLAADAMRAGRSHPALDLHEQPGLSASQPADGWTARVGVGRLAHHTRHDPERALARD